MAICHNTLSRLSTFYEVELVNTDRTPEGAALTGETREQI
jgi:hypothetical protein